MMGQAPYSVIPPPSPPTPVTPAEDADLLTSIKELSLDDNTLLNASNDRLAGAVHVLNTEATTLLCLARLYATDPTAREGFSRAVAAVAGLGTQKAYRGGKLTAIGVGKSGHVAKKLVATVNSLGVRAQFLHPTEALHGDLGQVGPHDALMLVTFSGKTPELLLLLPHLDPALPLILLTSHTRPDACELARRRPDAILLPAPVHEPESISFGVSAPTSSTTAALAVGDALALVAARELHPSVAAVFAQNHPGGAIGAAFRSSGAGAAGIAATTIATASISTISTASPTKYIATLVASNNPPGEVLVYNLAIPLADMSCLPERLLDDDSNNNGSNELSRMSTLTGADLLLAAYSSPSGWVRLHDGSVACPSRLRALSPADLARPLRELVREGVVLRPLDLVGVAANTPVRRAAAWIQDGLRPEGSESARGLGGGGRGVSRQGKQSVVVAVLEQGQCVAVVELDTLLAEAAEGV